MRVSAFHSSSVLEIGTHREVVPAPGLGPHMFSLVAGLLILLGTDARAPRPFGDGAAQASSLATSDKITTALA